ncbi:hypothetical protein [Natrononativus amylolyticus]|uniref:hypothetical protein n=1 Tax=Natrononativus amylolyticus TaxID=2963434 RepID=UPI0020CF53DA|nr:hypothetical protein [Natrononativus amylolyticus]
MDPTAEPWEIARDMTRKQYLTLAAIWNNGGEARTADVTSSSDALYNELVNNHFRKMIAANLLEETDEDRDRRSSPPSRGYGYRITDRGREVLSAAQEDYGMNPLEEGVVRNRLDELDGRLRAVEEELQDTDDDQSDDLERQIDELHEDFEALTRDVERVIDMVRALEKR